LAEITVSKTDLKDIRDSIDKLLKSGKENVTRHTQYASNETKELTEREKKILKYVKNNPGSIKESIIRERVIDNLDIGSRMTVHKSVDELIEDGMLIVRRDDSNQHIQHLYVNNENVVLSLLNDLDLFKQHYFRLIDESLNVFKKLAPSKESYQKIHNLLDILLMPYRNLTMICITSDILSWREPLDKETLHNKFSILYDGVQQIHTKLVEIRPSITIPIDTDFNIESFSFKHGLSPDTILYFLIDFHRFDLSHFAEAVLDSLWKISYPVLPKVNIIYSTKNRELLKDWRNIISQYGHSLRYKPKTTQEQNLGKHIVYH
jgi:hypothetical protein